MGVSELWSFLRGVGAMREWSADSEGTAGVQKACAAQVEGRVVAMDISQWAFNALSQQALAAVYERDETRVLKVAFDRIVNALRFGCTPVGVLDGEAPEAKLETLQKRFQERYNAAGGGGGNAVFERLCGLVADLFLAMGLWVVHAPGEAEATCAALNRAGHVHGCATNDGDALLFGAETLFHTLKLVSGAPKDCRVSRVAMADVQAYFGIARGGALALTAVALLSGGDYHQSGAEKVGHKLAVAVVKHLLRGRADDSGVLDDLAELLAADPEEDIVLLSQGKCTGCKRCGHEGGRKGAIKAHSGRNACGTCAMEGGACRERAYDACGCEWHAREAERVVLRALERVRATPGFAAAATRAKAAYQGESVKAAEAVEAFAEENDLAPAQKLAWRHRPNVAQVARLLAAGGLPWGAEVARAKMVALLMEWDAGHPGPDAEFVVESVMKLQGGNEDQCWRYLVAWRRTPKGDPEDVAADRAALESKKKPPEFRALRMGTVARHWPKAKAAFEAKRAAAADKAQKAAEHKAAKERGSKQSKATEQMAATMRAFLQRPKQQAPAAAEEKGGVAAAPAGAIDGAGRGLGAAHATGRRVHSGDSGGGGSSSPEEQQSQGPDQAPSSQELWARIMQQGDERLQKADALWQGMIPKPGHTTKGQPQGSGQPGKRAAPEDDAAATSAAPGTPGDVAQQAGSSNDVSLLASPGKRRRTPPASPEALPAVRPDQAAPVAARSLDAALAGSSSEGAAVPQCMTVPAEEAGLHTRHPQPGSTSQQQQQRQAHAPVPAVPQGPKRQQQRKPAAGRGRSRGAAAPGAPGIERFLQARPHADASNNAVPLRRQQHQRPARTVQNSSTAGAAPSTPGAAAGEAEEAVDLTQSTPPSRGAWRAQQSGREPVLATPEAQPRVLYIVTPSTGSDIFVDLISTPPEERD